MVGQLATGVVVVAARLGGVRVTVLVLSVNTRLMSLWLLRGGWWCCTKSWDRSRTGGGQEEI